MTATARTRYHRFRPGIIFLRFARCRMRTLFIAHQKSARPTGLRGLDVPLLRRVIIAACGIAPDCRRAATSR